MRRAAVIGDPVSHSLSPQIHGYWLQKYGIEGSYEALVIPSGISRLKCRS
jgi:shikimate dehydrogenase